VPFIKVIHYLLLKHILHCVLGLNSRRDGRVTLHSEHTGGGGGSGRDKTAPPSARYGVKLREESPPPPPPPPHSPAVCLKSERRVSSFRRDRGE
jgi:hypothetical protein